MTKEQKSIQQKQYRIKNADKLKAKRQKDYWNNPEKYRARTLANYYRDIEKSKRKAKEYIKKYRTKINAQLRHRYATDIQYRLKRHLLTRIGSVLRKRDQRKSFSFSMALGCSFRKLRAHLETKFSPGMSWNNYGDWHVDHIRPLSAFNLMDAAEFAAASHYTNLQPLWAKENLQKGSKRCDSEIKAIHSALLNTGADSAIPLTAVTETSHGSARLSADPSSHQDAAG